MRSSPLLAALGLLGAAAALTPAAAPPPRAGEASAVDRFFARYDRTKDGFIDRAECPEPMRKAFARLDADGDGKLSREELKGLGPRLDPLLDRGRGGRPGEVITPAAKGERRPDRLRVGEPAPDFTLPEVAGKGQVTLSSFRGKRPVVLVFASYT